MVRWSRLPLLGLLIASLACGDAGGQGGGEGDERTEPPVTASGSRDERPVVLFVGTSLTAGYGLDPAMAYPNVIQRKLDSAGLAWRSVNAGVSGETSAGALRRIEWLLETDPPAVLVLETGGNDGLRGLTPDSLKANILAILTLASRLDPPPLLVLAGMEAPPNLGETYTRRFRAVFAEAARERGALLIPFLLEGVAGVDSLNQGDGIHPTGRGQELVAETVWQVLEPVLRAAGSSPQR